MSGNKPKNSSKFTTSPKLTYHTYLIQFDPSLSLTTDEKTTFRSFVREILNDPKGWHQFGHRFHKIAANSNSKANSKSPVIPDVYVELSSPKRIKDTCNFTDLSCYNPNPEPVPHIYINYKNWNGGSKSKLPLTKYRYYVVNHEMGHHLGLLHPKSDQKCGKDSIASVMAQMSRGQQAIAPCLYENHLPIAIDGEALQRL